MSCVLDAAVVVSALRESEPHHQACLRRCGRVFSGREPLVVPAIFDLEVCAALVRRGVALPRVEQFLAAHLPDRHRVVIGPRAVVAAQRIVRTTRLRAADSLYVWVAARFGLPLVTIDEEVLSRAALAGVTAQRP
jgi:predicted nucleic acid-binding protein